MLHHEPSSWSFFCHWSHSDQRAFVITDPIFFITSPVHHSVFFFVTSPVHHWACWDQHRVPSLLLPLGSTVALKHRSQCSPQTQWLLCTSAATCHRKFDLVSRSIGCHLGLINSKFHLQVSTLAPPSISSTMGHLPHGYLLGLAKSHWPSKPSWVLPPSTSQWLLPLSLPQWVLPSSTPWILWSPVLSTHPPLDPPSQPVCGAITMPEGGIMPQLCSVSLCFGSVLMFDRVS